MSMTPMVAKVKKEEVRYVISVVHLGTIWVYFGQPELSRFPQMGEEE